MNFEKDYLKRMAGLESLKEALELVPKDEEHEKAKAAREEERVKKEAEAEKAAKKEEPKAEEKKEGSAASPSGQKKTHAAVAFLKANPSVSYSEFKKKAAGWGMSDKYAHGYFYGAGRAHRGKKDTNESFAPIFVLSHPMMPSHVLVENEMFSRYQWADPAVTDFPPVQFDSEEKADEFNDILLQTKNFYGNVEKHEYKQDEE